ncbi:unnamed protein product [Sphagnum jensenii]|uniref:Pectate lyase n=1 Tax=Sphagnum jensenii TaxID=128206 RepID=A0ABP1A952_9BRYO
MAGSDHQHLKEMKAGLCELHIQGSSSSPAPCEETSETMTIMGGGGGFCGGPYPDVDKSLRALAGAAEGFGHAAVGGLNGKLYYVTSLEDDGPGTLREGCNSKDPLWIVFKVSGTIPLIQGILVSSNKTIDGRGQHVKITGKSLQLFTCENVIICNLEFEGGTGPDVDGIQLKRGTSHIWIDRCTFSNYADGLIDITLQSSYVTVSR